MQSWSWANFRELDGYQTFRYGLFDEFHQLIGGCIFYFYPQRSSANIIFAPAAPILPKKYQVEGIQVLLAEAAKLAKNLEISGGAISLRIEPLLLKKPEWLNQDFRRSPADLMPSETLWIDLQKSESELLAEMLPKGRYNLRLSQRYGVETFFTSEDAAIPHFYDLFYETAQRQRFLSEPYGFFIKLCQTLFRAGMAEIGFAKYDGEILVAILLVYWGDRCTYLYGGRSERDRQVMPVYALHWAAMQRAKQHGHKIYDFYGYSDDPNHAYYKFSRFKRQFGGKVVKTIGAHDYFFYDRLADTIISLLK
ncbi:MAG: methicillin resistance protein [Pseudanabaena frigida]|uniref:Methicillin resistance protein n=1 Tax=Pseudanabaena frigida TaxID=945775 RepID=A0A2W4WHM7_9CYAN|nr:MAG: methicillin resistance protein [Pseudanabaena frigida]